MCRYILSGNEPGSAFLAPDCARQARRQEDNLSRQRDVCGGEGTVSWEGSHGWRPLIKARLSMSQNFPTSGRGPRNPMYTPTTVRDARVLAHLRPSRHACDYRHQEPGEIPPGHNQPRYCAFSRTSGRASWGGEGQQSWKEVSVLNSITRTRQLRLVLYCLASALVCRGWG